MNEFSDNVNVNKMRICKNVILIPFILKMLRSISVHIGMSLMGSNMFIVLVCSRQDLGCFMEI